MAFSVVFVVAAEALCGKNPIANLPTSLNAKLVCHFMDLLHINHLLTQRGVDN